ncbi:MAG TPA: ATP-binding cassette domain-containing protein [Acidimicrobiales bacterium]|jgi:iron complex transport system ATP-binding protein|nr:ATP-binding cassette domain-containing protein [Acidimicrobiales bacterium]
MTDPVLVLHRVTRVIDDRVLVHDIDWTVRHGERWVLLGRNGCGKTTLLRIASLYLHPTAGSVCVLGNELGRADIRRARERIGWSSASFADLLRPQLEADEVVMTAKHAALEPWWHTYDHADRARARALLERVGVGYLSGRTFGTLSSGERQRVLLARSLMNDPGLILLDEPTAALDLAGREQLIASLEDLAADPSTPPVVLVTHHVEEIPPSFTHVMLMRDGGVVAQGPIADHLTAHALADCFGLPLQLERRNGRWLAFAS